MRSPDGKLVGTNKIEAILDGCALSETWTAAGPGRGRSLNFYDTGTGRWHQTWMNNRGQPLLLNGGMHGPAMMLDGTLRDEKGRDQRQRITWSMMTAGRVRQLWEVSDDGGRTWRAVFDGIYMPR